jgi:hypothetical protein
MTSLRKLQQIYALFGPKTVLLPIQEGTKKCFREGWQNTTWEMTQQPRYQAELANGGIAVLFGPENLAGLDCDTEERVAEFLGTNPWASETLQTRGARGRTFHFRIRGNYPRLLCKLKTVDGQKIGEWRGADGYTVVSGIHPDTGEPYKFLVEKPPLLIDWSQIKWPAHWNAPWQQKTAETGMSGTPDGDLSRRILAYLARCPPAVSDNGGHIQTLKVATQLVIGFALGVDGAMPYLREYNKKCEPPWSEKELLHKAQEADKNKLGRELGAKIHEDEQNASHGGSCPYPAVDWTAIEKAAIRSGARFIQETIYPKNSILVPYMAFARRVCESSDTHLIGAILPVVGALLARRVYINWPQRKIYPNLFSLLIGPAGQRKTDAVKLAAKIAWSCLPGAAFLKKHLSTEALFEEYWEESGGLPDKIQLVDDANILLASWSKTEYGARVAAEFLDLYDCGPLSESFMRNKTKKTGAGRFIPETSTSVVLAGTFNVAMFPLEQIKQGIQRRFMFNVAEKLGRTIHWPTHEPSSLATEAFKPLLAFDGQIDMPQNGEVWNFWEHYQTENRALLNEVGLDNEPLSARLATTPTSVLKVATLFEACMAAYNGLPSMPKMFSLESLETAANYVEAHMKAAEFIDRYGARKVAQEQAEVILAIVRREFNAARPGTIYVTRSELTRKFCLHAGRRGAMTPDDLYLQIIPELERQGEVVRVLKRGKFEVYAFRTEESPSL